MLLELTPDESRYLCGLLNEQLGEVRATIHGSRDERVVRELTVEEIRLQRIIHRLTSAESPLSQ